MAWKKVPPENEALLDDIMKGYPAAEKRRMFGCPVYFLNDVFFVGAHEDNFILRLSEADQQEILAREDVSIFCPMPGRVMREYVVIPPAIYRSPEQFSAWLQRSMDYAKTVPPKPKRAKKARSRKVYDTQG
ncbi:MAG: TfoX/Sxy family protein [Armatimonadota bacterium]